MMKISLSILTVLFLFTTAGLKAQQLPVQKALKQAGKQTRLMLEQVETADKGDKKNLVSPRTLINGELKMVASGDWTSGFFPGVLWYLHSMSKKDTWLDAAKKYTAHLEKEQFNTSTHDLGFIIYCSFGNGYKNTNSEQYRNVIIQGAKSLSKRFNPVTGTIRSWDHNRNKWAYPVIIDNMMNLELLFEATTLTGDSSFYKIAVTHADNTLKNHFRPDFSSYHVVDYDVNSGAVLGKATHQGYSHESAWARGQAWALYGYTICYRATKNKVYLQQAESIAQYILNHPAMPADMVPYWDYNDPQIPAAPRDASAAAITASALYELSGYSKNETTYKTAANKMLSSLISDYTSKPGDNRGFILDHSTGHKPAKSEIDVPLNYADYYYLEALSRSQKVNAGKAVVLKTQEKKVSKGK